MGNTLTGLSNAKMLARCGKYYPFISKKCQRLRRNFTWANLPNGLFFLILVAFRTYTNVGSGPWLEFFAGFAGKESFFYPYLYGCCVDLNTHLFVLKISAF